MVFKALAGPAEKSWREELFQLSKKYAFTNTQNKKVLPPVWFQFYGVTTKAFNLSDADADTAGETAEKVWGWCIDQVRSKEFQEMSAVVAEHLARHRLR